MHVRTSRLVYILGHVTLHVESIAQKVNYMKLHPQFWYGCRFLLARHGKKSWFWWKLWWKLWWKESRDKRIKETIKEKLLKQPTNKHAILGDGESDDSVTTATQQKLYNKVN